MPSTVEAHSQNAFPESISPTQLHFSDVQKAMFNATADCIKVVSPDGRLITMNRAGCLALGIPETSDFGMPWLSVLPEEVRPLGLEALREAASGRIARFPGKSISSQGTQYWDNMLTPLTDASGTVGSILCISRDVTKKTLLAKQLEEAIAREKLLSREMQHRIKNLLSVVSGLVAIAEKEATEENNTASIPNILRDKLGALARASDAVFSHEQDLNGEAPPAELDAVIRSLLQPYGERCSIAGSPALMRRESVTAFALFIHELATNSVKYGALAAADGNVAVHWATSGELLKLTWVETGGPAIVKPPEHQGFGSEMADRAMRSIGGIIRRTWHPSGLVAELQLPGFSRDAET